MQKEIPTGTIIAAIVGLLAVAVVVIFFAAKKGDPAMQAPNAPPTVNVQQKAAESTGHGTPFERGPASANGGQQRPAPVVQ